MSNLAARVLTAVVLVPLVMLGIFWKNPLGVYLLVIIAGGLAVHEYFSMTTRDHLARTMGTVLALGFMTGLYFLSPRGDGWVLALVAAVVLAAFMLSLFRLRPELAGAAGRVGTTAFGALYGGLLVFAAMMRRDRGDRGWAWMVLLLTVTFVGDTGAYAAGRIAGRHKLYPAVSPGKTWEGALGGLVASFGAAALAHAWYLPELGWGHAAAVSLPAAVLGQIGDLCESMLKRAYGVKDSGSILPGHGGMLDRIDALLFAAPYFYFYTRFAL
jgi:phosphatidate cytidylyltransferase